MSLESSESEILPGETASGANEISTANSSQNLTPSSFEDVVPSESPNDAAAAVNAESNANAATPTLAPSDATAAPAATAAAAPTASKKPRSEKQAAADAGAKKILDEVLIPRYATEFADISEKFRPKAKPLVARKLFYTANSAEKERIIKSVIAKDREAAQARENGKTRKNRNRTAAKEQKAAAATAAKEAKAAASLAAKEAKAAEMAAARAANPTAPRTRRLKAALNAAAEMGATNSAVGATTRKKTVGFSNNGMTATAAARARLDAKMLEKFGSEADKMKEKLNKVAGTVEAKLAQTGRQVAEELRKIADRFSETSSKYATTRKAGNTAATGLTASRSSRKKNATAATAAAVENAGLSAIPEGEESNATPENTSKPESEYFG
jgi:hypothetical protein